MSDYYKCSWCGKSFEKSAGAKFLSGASMGVSNLGKKYCSKSCEKSAEEKNGPKSSSSSSNFAIGANASQYKEKEIENQRRLEEDRHDFQLELEEKRQEHEIKLASIQSTNNSIEKINDIDFGGTNPTFESISKDLDLCLTIASTYLTDSFTGSESLDIKEKFSQAEKIINASIKKAELGLNKLKLIESSEKALQYYAIYKEQVKETKIKQVNRTYEFLIKDAKPETWVWFACFVFFPALLFPLLKTYKALVVLPKKRDSEISRIQ
jgi:hypothetical protein